MGTALRLWRYSAAADAEDAESRADLEEVQLVPFAALSESGRGAIVEILGVDLHIVFNVFLVIVVRGIGVVIKECIVFLLVVVVVEAVVLVDMVVV